MGSKLTTSQHMHSKCSAPESHTCLVCYFWMESVWVTTASVWELLPTLCSGVIPTYAQMTIGIWTWIFWCKALFSSLYSLQSLVYYPFFITEYKIYGSHSMSQQSFNYSLVVNSLGLFLVWCYKHSCRGDCVKTSPYLWDKFPWVQL